MKVGRSLHQRQEVDALDLGEEVLSFDDEAARAGGVREL
jgi:hypothetical protein